MESRLVVDLPTVSDLLPPPAARRSRPSVDLHAPRVIEVSRRVVEDPVVPDVQPRERSEVLSRAVNVAIAGVAILILLPVLVLVALAVRLTSRGPVIYTQTRVGLDRRWRQPWRQGMYDRRVCDLGGRAFRIYKFRTMRVDAEKNGAAMWASKNDSRVTVIGNVLRKCRLDELPQLFNVIKGDMNIVGPRPERPAIVARLRGDIETYPLRHRVRPGITGLAQISQAYDTCLDDVRSKVAYDVEYLQRQSMAADLLIMAKTLPVMLFRRGAH